MGSTSLHWCILCFILPHIHTISLSCYKPTNVASSLYTNYVEIMVDCSVHGFGMREDLLLHQSNLCVTTPALCDLITGFDYSYNAIRVLGKPRYEFPLINTLLFKHNYIYAIEDDAFSGEKISLVDLSHNKITGSTLRKNIFRGKYNSSRNTYQDSSIEKLFLGYNDIAHLNKDSFYYLKKLTTLELNNNPLSVIGDSTIWELQSLPRLYVLHLGSTNISHIPDRMFSKMRLQSLFLNGNKLTKVPNLVPLEECLLNLNLDNNLIAELDENSFPELRYLTNLNLSSNQDLQAIKKNSFRNLFNLQSLYCNFNPKLGFIHPYAFNIDWSLRELYINNNALTSLPHELGEWENLEVLEIQSNPWTCDCSIQWLIDYVAKRQRSEPELNYNLYCSEPRKFNGIHILSNNVLAHISEECVKSVLAISKLSSQFYKLYPLLFVMLLLLTTMVAYLIFFSYRYIKNHAPYVCNYTVQYNKLDTRISK